MKLEKLTLNSLQMKKVLYIKKGYNLPKWVLFSEELIKDEWKVELCDSKSTVSKYLYISKNGQKFKIRFSNHKPNKQKESQKDCDYYVGVGNKGVITTEQVLKLIKNNQKLKQNG